MTTLFANQKVSARIYLALTVALFGLLFLTTLGAISLNQIAEQTESLIGREFRLTRAMSDLRGAVGNLRRYEKDVFINLADAEKVASYRNKWNEALAKAYQALDSAEPLASSTTQAGTLKTLRANIDAYRQGFNEVADRLQQGEFLLTSEANATMEPLKEPIRQIGDLVASLSEEVDSSAHASGESLHAGARQASATMLIGSLAITLLAGLFAILIARSITRPLAEVGRMANEISSRKDLSLHVPDHGRNEIGDMVQALNVMVGATRHVITQVKHAVDQTAQTSRQMTDLSRQVSASTNQQAQSTSNVAVSVEELTVTINMVSENTQDVRKDSEMTLEEATQAVNLARQTTQEISKIASDIVKTAEVINALNRRSEEIGGIVQVIKEIAEQTNLLALNAAIESARAGEQGRGFAVVADEVRKLAERTTLATQEISGMIAAVQNETKQVNEHMGAAKNRISQGVDFTNQVQAALEHIGEVAQRVAGKVSDIANAIREQSAASNIIARNIEQIAQTSDNNAAAAITAEKSAMLLSGLAQKMEQSIEQFRV